MSWARAVVWSSAAGASAGALPTAALIGFATGLRNEVPFAPLAIVVLGALAGFLPALAGVLLIGVPLLKRLRRRGWNGGWRFAAVGGLSGAAVSLSLLALQTTLPVPLLPFIAVGAPFGGAAAGFTLEKLAPSAGIDPQLAAAAFD